ncbi:MAG: hypothetical protein H7A51_18720 [Akkermansiaceae bacterium]|nr:hypothetical protein [Akkermansiaceae bacterium]
MKHLCLIFLSLALPAFATPINLQVSQSFVSLSAVKGYKSQSATITITNPTSQTLPSEARLSGEHHHAFLISETPKELSPGKSYELTIQFNKTQKSFLHSASIQLGPEQTGTEITLRGIGLQQFEGKNEPPLLDIVKALGIPLKVGGSTLHLDTKAATIGQSLDASHFQAIDNKQAKITPLARFSPKGKAPFGYFLGQKKHQLGELIDSSKTLPDAHQCLFPDILGAGKTLLFNAPAGAFNLYFQGHKQLSCTDTSVPTTAKIKHTARIYPVTSYQGKALENAYLVGFEEASNGDYQDALFLIENVSVIKQ